ncbi:MAG TPA: ATP synthase F1 subunit delta [Bacteroidales bacterium]|nr:ATP synthase F1 subunit delta [Bacteroidales bacterium]
MNAGQIAVRYAKALYEAAAEVGEESLIHDALELIQQQASLVPAFPEALMSPLVDEEAKLGLMRVAGGDNQPASLERFFKLLVDHGREDALIEICQAFKLRYDKEKGIVKVRLITAVALDEAREAVIRKKLEDSTGRLIELSLQVKPEIIGGYILMTDEKRLDASVRTQLLTIQKQLTI